VLAQCALAVLTTQMDAFNRILGTTSLDLRQFEWALLPPVAVFVLWEVGKLVARRQSSRLDEAELTPPAGGSPSKHSEGGPQLISPTADTRS
jgi:Ca2+-transporting ATPase